MPRLGIVLWAAVVLPLTRVPDARGQGVAAPVVAADSARVPGLLFQPAYTGRIRGDASSMTFTNEMNSQTHVPWGTILNGLVRVEKRVFRENDRVENNRTLSGGMLHVFTPGFAANLTYTDDRRSGKELAVSGLQDFLFANQSILGSVGYARLLGSLRYDVRGTGSLLDSESTFKTDASQLASVNGGASYGFFDGFLSAGVRGAYKRNDETSRTSLASYGGLGGTEDSLSASVKARVSDSLTVAFKYSDHSAERRYTDQARGAQGSQQVGEENVYEERTVATTRSYDLRLDTRPIRGLSFKMGATRLEQVNDYAVNKRLFSGTISDLMDAALTYATRWGSTVDLKLENRQVLHDLGPQSIGSYDEEGKSFDIRLDHRFTKTLQMIMSYKTTLRQYFYIDYEANPRDRDQLDNLVRLDLSSTLFTKFSVGVGMSWSETQFINIDASQSEGNRVKSRYDFRPSITYRVNDRLTIVQNYGLALEFTDFTFTETDNFLDRNVTFSNEFRVTPTPNLQGKFYYGLTLHDRGSYLPLEPGGERFLTVDTEDRRDQIELGVRYRMGPHLSLEGDYEFSHKEDRAVGGVGRDRVTEDGSIRAGIVAKQNWGNGRTLNLTLKRARRHGPFVSEAQRDFWIMNGELRYAF